MKFKINSSRILFSIIKFYRFISSNSNKVSYSIQNYFYTKEYEKYKIRGYSISLEKYFYCLFFKAKFYDTNVIISKISPSAGNKNKKQKIKLFFFTLKKSLKWYLKKKKKI